MKLIRRRIESFDETFEFWITVNTGALIKWAQDFLLAFWIRQQFDIHYGLCVMEQRHPPHLHFLWLQRFIKIHNDSTPEESVNSHSADVRCLTMTVTIFWTKSVQNFPKATKLTRWDWRRLPWSGVTLYKSLRQILGLEIGGTRPGAQQMWWGPCCEIRKTKRQEEFLLARIRSDRTEIWHYSLTLLMIFWK